MGHKRKRKLPSPTTQEPIKRQKPNTPQSKAPNPPASPPKPNSTLANSSTNPTNLPSSEYHPILSLYYNSSTSHALLRLSSYLLHTLHTQKAASTDPIVLRACRKSIKKLRKVLATAPPTDALKSLLENTLVAFRTGDRRQDEQDGADPDDETFTSSGGSSIGNISIGELVGHATKTLYSRFAAGEKDSGGWEAWKRRNVLLQGYGIGRGTWDARGDGSVGGEAWERLVKVVGDVTVWELLVHTNVFVGVGGAVGKGFVQVCGAPVGEMVLPVHTSPTVEGEKKRKLSPCQEDEGRKRPRMDTGLGRKMAAKRTPGQIAFVRMRMYFGRPSFTKSMEVKHGFKNHHVLNRFNKADNRDHVIQVMKYIFPWQFGLHNVFCSDVNKFKTTQPFQDYTYRPDIDLDVPDDDEGGVSLRKQFIPKRLMRAEGLIETLIRRNRRIKYGLILKHHCPSMLLDGRSPESQSTDDNCDPSASPSSVSLVAHATPQSQVIKYILSIVQHLVPLGFFGTLINLREIQKAIGRFIHLRKFETMTLHTFSQNIDMKSIAWLGPATPKMSRPDMEKRRELLLEFLYWLMDSIVIPLIANTFYVTDISDNTDKRLLYFRQDVWRELTGPINADLKIKMFAPLTPGDFPPAAKHDLQLSHVKKTKYLPPKSMIPPSTFRIVPKLGKGYRIITNMRRRTTQANGQLGPAPNTILKPILPILRYYRDKNKKFMMGSSMDSPSDFFPRVSEFKSRLKEKHLWKTSNTNLHFVKVDIRKCYDTIPADKLLSYLRSVFNLPKEDEESEGSVNVKAFQIHNYTKITPSGPAATHRKFTFYAKPVSVHTSFVDDVKKLAKERESNTPYERLRPTQVSGVSRVSRTKKSVVYVGHTQRKGQVHHLDTVYKILQEHLTKHIVKIGPKYYRQKRGVPQGSILSTLLVNMFYAKMEREELGFTSGQYVPCLSSSFSENEEEAESLLTRYVDDFLLITTSRAAAERFLETLLPALPEYGATTHPEKALCNFPNKYNIPVHRSRFFPYIGLDISTEDLSINVTHKFNLRKGADQSLSRTKSKITLPTNHPLRTLPVKLLKSFAFKHLDTRYTSTALNSSRTIRRNVAEIWKDLARQARAYLSVLVPGYRKTRGLGRFEDRKRVEKVMEELVRGARQVLGRKLRGDRAWVGRLGEKILRKFVFGDGSARGRLKGKWNLRELRRG